MRLMLVLLLLIGCRGAQPDLPLDQNAVLTWLTQRGLETRELQIVSWGPDSGGASGMPQRIQFQTPKPAGDLENWRVQLRDELGGWLSAQGHPEGQCTSVDLDPVSPELLAIDIQIVCR